jgi:hypothetical protein
MGKFFSYADYPRGWHRWSRYLREARAGWACEQCGVKHGQVHLHTGSKEVLTLAHLDHDCHNNNPRNLAVFCRRCHLAHDREDNRGRIRRAWVRKAVAAGHLFGEVLEATTPPSPQPLDL